MTSETAVLTEQLAVLAFEPFLDLFLVGIFPEPLLDRFVSGHLCPPHPAWSGLYAKPGSALLGGVRGRWRRLQKDPVGSSG
jgi:hypothetical protein